MTNARTIMTAPNDTEQQRQPAELAFNAEERKRLGRRALEAGRKRSTIR